MSGNEGSARQGLSTAAVHAGEGKGHWGQSLTVPIAQTSTYVFPDTKAVEDFVAGRSPQLD